VSSSAGIRILAATLLAGWQIWSAGPLLAQDSTSRGTDTRILEGAFTDEQRQQGMHLYIMQCSSCHGERLHGGESGPPLSGSTFRMHWVGRTLDDLRQKIDLMPPKDPGRLTPEESANLIAVILAANDLPAAHEDFPPAYSSLGQIRIEFPKYP
jgi:mono/diheme cytochrome c family protein